MSVRLMTLCFEADLGSIRYTEPEGEVRSLSAPDKAVLLAMALTWVLSAAIVVVILFTPTYLQTIFKVAPRVSLQANSVAIV